MASFIDTYHSWGAEFISYLQTVLPHRGAFFMQVSDIGDPGLAFTFYFPLVIALHAAVGVRLMWAIVFCEWSNMILKWLMAGDRPFWWVHETPMFAYRLPPALQQFPRTCETGPGMPSGHAKLNAAMFYVLLSAFNDLLVKRAPFLSERQKVLVSRGLWVSYTLWMALVIVARVYISAHFPHQCIIGAIIGLVIAIMVSRQPRLQVLSRAQYLTLTATIMVTVIGTYLGFKAMGGDVLWSVAKAIKWCLRREWIHIDSTPFYSFSRYSGVSLGLGLGLSSSWYKKVNRERFTKKMILSLVILSLGASQTGVFIHQSLSPKMTGWYVAEFCVNATVTFALVAVIPHLVRIASNVPAGDKFKKK